MHYASNIFFKKILHVCREFMIVTGHFIMEKVLASGLQMKFIQFLLIFLGRSSYFSLDPNFFLVYPLSLSCTLHPQLDLPILHIHTLQSLEKQCEASVASLIRSGFRCIIGQLSYFKLQPPLMKAKEESVCLI
ncbi:hypothetical protein SDJN02_04390, partial [Cucurbita argyrosperma subsp. argyrosperma]